MAAGAALAATTTTRTMGSPVVPMTGMVAVPTATPDPTIEVIPTATATATATAIPMMGAPRPIVTPPQHTMGKPVVPSRPKGTKPPTAIMGDLAE